MGDGVINKEGKKIVKLIEEIRSEILKTLRRKTRKENTYLGVDVMHYRVGKKGVREEVVSMGVRIRIISDSQPVLVTQKGERRKDKKGMVK